TGAVEVGRVVVNLVIDAVLDVDAELDVVMDDVVMDQAGAARIADPVAVVAFQDVERNLDVETVDDADAVIEIVVEAVVLDEVANHLPSPVVGAEPEALKGSRDPEAIDRVKVV